MNDTRLLRVSSIRSANPVGIGGCIFYGAAIDDGGSVLNAGEHYVVVASARRLGATSVQVGQWWRVHGVARPNSRTVNGYRIVEQQVEAEDLELVLPSGEHLITLLAESDGFEGVGVVKARRLWEAFGERLYDILDQGDISTLKTKVSEETAQTLVAGWRLYGDARTLHWLHRHSFDVALGRKLIAFFGGGAPRAIEEDPYRLLSFCANWSTTDRLAREHFGVAADDPRRLQGAIEEALYRLFGDGHTAATRQMVMSRLASILGEGPNELPWRPLAASALDAGLQSSSYIVSEDNLIHPLGAYIMETSVAAAFASRLLQDELDGLRLLDVPHVESIVAAYEDAEQLTLNAEQRAAIHAAAAGRLATITGGAGVGKTTVLKALYRIYDEAGLLIVQSALAGLAAKRMQDATGRPARTLARLLRNTVPADFEDPCVVVIDEASMVDIITMYRLCSLLPPHARLVLVGDPLQLMPVGPGLVLHALANHPRVPSVRLKVAKRFGGEIAQAADAIRDGNWPTTTADESAPVVFLRRSSRLADDNSQQPSYPIAETVLRLYRESPESTQILSPRKGGIDGVKALNALCQQTLAADAEKLTMWSAEFSTRFDTGFRLGDPVVCTRNIWSAGLQNGSLGWLAEIEKEPRAIFDDKGNIVGHAIAWIAWDDGERRPVFESLLDDLELAYALTVHKAQGSQWPRVIVAVTGHRLLDRTLIYTAITRAQRQVILVGDEDAARRAVRAVPRANLRNTALASSLARLLDT
ncbi:ATP-dependent DNA helicase [Paraburkholderia phytofirmans]|uniref:ATP-dependent DNA helicase n=1 Tax=Paraburkholderia phytofirmans TaxID=261302 RepID=UPI0038BDE3E1